MELSHYSARVPTGFDIEAELLTTSQTLSPFLYTLNSRAALNSIHLIGSILLQGDRRLEWSEV